MLAKLNCFGIVCGFSLVKRKTDIKNCSLENIGNYFEINKYRKELSYTFGRENMELHVLGITLGIKTYSPKGYKIWYL